MTQTLEPEVEEVTEDGTHQPLGVYTRPKGVMAGGIG